MSSTIGIIIGKFEAVISGKDRKVAYLDQSLLITRFNGGDGRGMCLQLNIGNQHIQLDTSQIHLLLQVLQDWKNKEEIDDF